MPSKSALRACAKLCRGRSAPSASGVVGTQPATSCRRLQASRMARTSGSSNRAPTGSRRAVLPGCCEEVRRREYSCRGLHAAGQSLTRSDPNGQLPPSSDCLSISNGACESDRSRADDPPRPWQVVENQLTAVALQHPPLLVAPSRHLNTPSRLAGVLRKDMAKSAAHTGQCFCVVDIRGALYEDLEIMRCVKD